MMVFKDGSSFLCDDLLKLSLCLSFVGLVVGEAIADVLSCLRAGKDAMRKLSFLFFATLVAGVF